MKSSKKILGASAALGLAVALSAGSTFAWFTTGKTNVNVDSFQLSATANSTEVDLQVAFAAIGTTDVVSLDYGYSLSWDEITDSALKNVKNTKLKPLTYDVGGKEWTTNKTETYEAAGADAGLVGFSLVFKSPANMPVKIYLAGDSAVEAVEINDGNPKLTADTIEHTTIQNRLKSGYYTGTTLSDGSSVQARMANASRVLFRTTDKNTAHVWCPNEYNVDGSEETTSTTANDTAKGFWKNNLAGDIAAVAKLLADGTPLSGIDEAAIAGETITATAYTGIGVEKYSVSGETVSGTVLGTTASDGSVGFNYLILDVYVWIEGTDGDCMNSILGDAMNIILGFQGVK